MEEREIILAEKRKYKREWVKRNRERVNAYAREWRKNNLQKIKAINERYWERKAQKIEEGARDGV